MKHSEHAVSNNKAAITLNKYAEIKKKKKKKKMMSKCDDKKEKMM